MAIRKPEAAPTANGVPGGAPKGDDWVLYPTVMEYLTEDRYEDGSARRTSTLSVFTDQGQIKLSINDRDLDRVAFVSAASIEACLVILEDKLKSSSADWRKSQRPGGGKRR